MSPITAYLSPNGENLSEGTGPATRLRIATVGGVATLERERQGAPWVHTGTTLAERHIGSLLYEPVSGKLFAGAHDDGGLWVSDDGEGARWRQVSKGLDRPHIYSLAQRRRGDRVTLFLGTQPAGLYRSEDLGESWSEHRNAVEVPDTDKWTFPAPPHIAHVKNVEFHPREANTLYVLVEQGALLKTADDCKSWRELAAYSDPNEVAYRDVHRLLINPAKPSEMYLATGEGLYRSDDGGESWDHLMKRGQRIGYPDFLFQDPKDERVLYMAGALKNPGSWMQTGTADACVMKSTDRGESWTELTNGLPQPMVAAYEAMCQHRWPGGHMLVLGNATGQIYASEDNGSSWQCIAAKLAPVSKDNHHFPFMSAEERQKIMAARRARNAAPAAHA
jgi:photosystem II stability/assembly factor-like uncharacterized protein